MLYFELPRKEHLLPMRLEKGTKFFYCLTFPWIGRTLLGKRKLLPRSRELVAAIAALATGWRAHPRTLELLALAAVSDDADVRAATDPEAAES